MNSADGNGIHQLKQTFLQLLAAFKAPKGDFSD